MSSKLEIVYEINAKVGNFTRAIGTSQEGLKRLTNELKNTEKVIQNALKGKTGRGDSGLEVFFQKVNDDADLLRQKMAALKKIPSGRSDAIIIARNEVVATAKQYAASVKAAAKAAQAEYKLGEAERFVAEQAKNASNAINQEITSLDKLEGHLVSARYALYDMANTSMRLGTALIGTSAATIKIAADFERAFIDVQRTYNDANGAAISGTTELRAALKELSTTTSLNFKDLSKLATLANQFGIAGKDVAAFTETTAKFSIVTGTAVETSATALARISQLLGLTSQEYDNLASSVLFAGRNAIATEEQILVLTQQLAATAKQAGMTADETVGLATALSSLGIAPELARGSILRLFGQFDKVVAQGGANLDNFARVMGMTNDEVRNLWAGDNRNAIQFFTRFTQSLNELSANGQSANLVLNKLGINQVRDILVLQKVAGSQDVLTSSLADAVKGYSEANDVQKQFDMVMGTLTEKLGKLNNAVQAFADSAGGSLIPVISTIVDGLASIISTVANSPILSSFASFATILAAVGGAFLLVNALLLKFSASMVTARFLLTQVGLSGNIATMGYRAMGLALKNLIPSQVAANAGAKQFTASLYAQSGATGAAAASTRVMSMAMKAIPYVLVVAGIFEIANAMNNSSAQADRFSEKLRKVVETGAQVGSLDMFKKSDFWSWEVQNPLNALNLTNTKVVAGLSEVQQNLKLTQEFINKPAADNYIAGLDQSLADLVKSGNAEQAALFFDKIKIQGKEVGFTVDKLSSLFPVYSKAARSVLQENKDLSLSMDTLTDSSGTYADQIKTELNSAFVDGANQQTRFSSATLDFVQAIKDSKGSLNEWTTEGSKAKSAFADLISVIADQAPDMFTALQQTAGAISLIEKSGGDASSEVETLVEQINGVFGLTLDPTTITSMDKLRTKIQSAGDIADSTKASIMSLLSGGSFAKGLEAAFSRLQSNIAAANREIKTTKDYASDLASVLSRAFTLRFGKGSAISEFRNAVKDINDGLKSAKEKLNDLSTTQNELQVKRIDIQTQIDYANAIGDTQTAADLMGELAKIDAEIATNAEDAAYYTERFSGSLDLNTQAGRDNRDAMLKVVTSTNEYVASLAEAGATSAELNAAIEEGRVSLQNLGTSLGISQTDVAEFSKGLTDAATAIAKVPKNVTIKVTTNAAQTAVDEFIANVNKQKATIQITADLADIKGLVEDAERQRKAAAKTILDKRKAALISARDAAGKSSSLWGVYNDQIKSIDRTIAAGTYASGGLVQGEGSATSDSIPAWLSNGEYVIKASAVKSVGVDFLNAINQQRPVSIPSYGSMSGGAGPAQVVYLSASDRELLAAAANRPVTLYTSDRIIADSANRGNRELARRGKN